MFTRHNRLIIKSRVIQHDVRAVFELRVKLCTRTAKSLTTNHLLFSILLRPLEWLVDSRRAHRGHRGVMRSLEAT